MIKGHKYLVTADGWFIAPDGQQYKAIWGAIEILSDSILGVKTNARSANWYAKIGTDNNHVIVAGCQIHYAVKCENRPSSDFLKMEDYFEGKAVMSDALSRIYFAE